MKLLKKNQRITSLIERLIKKDTPYILESQIKEEQKGEGNQIGEMIAKLLSRSVYRNYFFSSKRFFASEATFQSQKPQYTQRTNNREFVRNPRNQGNRNEGEQNYQDNESNYSHKPPMMWDEYFNKYANAKIHSINEVAFPFNFRGMPDFAPVKKEFDNIIFAKGENYADFVKQFDRRIVWFLKALAANKDEELPFGELNFLLQAKKGAELLRRNGYTIKFVEDYEGFEKSGITKGGSPFEITHIMGLNCIRTRNPGTKAYSIIRDLEEKGLIIFKGNQMKVNTHGQYDFKLTRDDDKQMILRVHYKYASPYILQVLDSSGKVVSPAPESYIHTAVFENQLRLPPKFSRLDLHFLEWIKLYRIQNEWRLVDIDRFLQGNKLIYSPKESQELYKIQR